MGVIDDMLAACGKLTTNKPDPELKRITSAFLNDLFSASNPTGHVNTLKHLPNLPPAGAAWLSVAFGTAVEHGKNPSSSVQPMVNLLRSWLPSFPALPDTEKQKPDEQSLTSYQKELAAAMPWLCQSIVAHLVRMPEFRDQLAQDTIFLLQLEKVEGYTHAASWVRELLGRRSGSLLALHPESGRALKFNFLNIRNCYHLFTLLQIDIGRRLPGGRLPRRRLFNVASGKSEGKATDTALWHFGDPKSAQPNLLMAIKGESSVDNIPVIDGLKVLVLWPVQEPLEWNADYFRPIIAAAPPSVRLNEELNPEDAGAWFDKLGIEVGKREQAHSSKNIKPWWKIW